MIRFIMPYFGNWPVWMPLFLESCRRQKGYEWILVGEQTVPYDLPENVNFVEMTLQEVEQRIQACGLSMPKDFIPYKFCDYKPAYGLIFADLIDGANFWGHGDLDLAYGRLSELINESSLTGIDVFSADDRSCGHFQIYRNEDRVNRLILQIKGLDQLLRLRSTVGLDEPQMSQVLAEAEKEEGLNWKRGESRKSELTKERPFMGATIEPDGHLVEQELKGMVKYRWADGKAEQFSAGAKQPTREFLYLHWFQWKDSTQWRILLEDSHWLDEGVELQASDWPVARGKVKSGMRKILYHSLGILGMILGHQARRIEVMDKACAFVIRQKAEREWQANPCS